MPLTLQEKNFLLSLARYALREGIAGQTISFPEDKVTPRLRQKQCCFVTYRNKGDLRGCIGSTAATKPLYQEVIDKAVQAATKDTRFTPIAVDELDEISIEITILSVPIPISSPDEFIPGEHGIILTKDKRRAVYLPQVAVEQNWGREKTLSNLALKAGLGPNDWKTEATLEIFTAQVI